MSQASLKSDYASEIWNIISGGNVEPRMVVVGCGGAGSHIVGRLENRIRGVPRVAINTDFEGMKDVSVDKKICIGKAITLGQDSAGFPEVAEKCAELAKNEVKECMVAKDVAFVVVSFGGGTGTGIAPHIAQVARDMGLVVFGIVILPFKAEKHRRERAEGDVLRLKQVTESTIVLDNENLLKMDENITLEKAFKKMDDSVVQIIMEVAERMSRSFMSVIADEIIAYHEELGLAETVGEQSPVPEASHEEMAAGITTGSMGYTAADQSLVSNGGLFQRNG